MSTDSKIEDQARLQGFEDCEDLIVAWLEREASVQGTFPFSDRQVALRSAALAIKLGQHRTGEDGA